MRNSKNRIQTSVTFQSINGLVLKVREENLVRVDLHGKKSTEVREAILHGISDARIKSASIVEVIHGYNHGSILKRTTESELLKIQKDHHIRDFYISPRNQGSTILHLN